jgi:hypothetical protein
MHQAREARQAEGWSPAVHHPADNLNIVQAALEQVHAVLASTRLEAHAIAVAGGEVPMNKLRRLEEVETGLTSLMQADEIAHEVDSRLNAPKGLVSDRFDAMQSVLDHLDIIKGELEMMRLAERRLPPALDAAPADK